MMFQVKTLQLAIFNYVLQKLAEYSRSKEVSGQEDATATLVKKKKRGQYNGEHSKTVVC